MASTNCFELQSLLAFNCSKSTIETPGKCVEYVDDFVLATSLLTLTRQTPKLHSKSIDWFLYDGSFGV